LLGDLEPAELELVRQREASGRAHPWILARVDALLEAEADADTSEHAWGPGPIGTAGQQGRLIDDEDEIAEVEPDDADWASPRDRASGRRPRRRPGRRPACRSRATTTSPSPRSRPASSG